MKLINPFWHFLWVLKLNHFKCLKFDFDEQTNGSSSFELFCEFQRKSILKIFDCRNSTHQFTCCDSLIYAILRFHSPSRWKAFRNLSISVSKFSSVVDQCNSIPFGSTSSRSYPMNSNRIFEWIELNFPIQRKFVFKFTLCTRHLFSCWRTQKPFRR